MELGTDVGLAGELFARQQLDPEAGTGGNPMEFMVSGWKGVGEGTLRFGMGGALIKGVGAAKLRALLTWVPGKPKSLCRSRWWKSRRLSQSQSRWWKSRRLSQKPARVQITQVRIEINESVYFETARSTIKPESFDLLNEVAELLNKHPEVLKVRIEGHTDIRGTIESNQALSDRRARFGSAGTSSTEVLQRSIWAPSATASSSRLTRRTRLKRGKKNRRVDFFIEERAEVEPEVVPVEEAPAEEAPVEEAPAEEAPAGNPLQREAPVEEAL